MIHNIVLIWDYSLFFLNGMRGPPGKFSERWETQAWTKHHLLRIFFGKPLVFSHVFVCWRVSLGWYFLFVNTKWSRSFNGAAQFFAENLSRFWILLAFGLVSDWTVRVRSLDGSIMTSPTFDVFFCHKWNITIACNNVFYFFWLSKIDQLMNFGDQILDFSWKSWTFVGSWPIPLRWPLMYILLPVM